MRAVAVDRIDLVHVERSRPERSRLKEGLWSRMFHWGTRDCRLNLQGKHTHEVGEGLGDLNLAL